MSNDATTAISKTLPPALLLANVSLADALMALSERLTELAGQMPRLADINLDLDIQPDGRCTLVFRACR
jgi:hypothetical protein